MCGVKALRKLTVREYAIEQGISDTAVRKQIKRNQLRTTYEMLNNKKTTLILLENDFQSSSEPESTIESNQKEPGSEPIQDAEFIESPQNFQLVSMEQSSFDNLIQSFKEMAEQRAESDQTSYEKLETAYFELKTRVTNLEEENKNMYKKVAISEAELRIKDMTIQEKTEKIKELQNQVVNQQTLIEEMSLKIEKSKSFWALFKKEM
jgi:hypothetical protein